MAQFNIIINADKMLSESIAEVNSSYKYSYLRPLVIRLRVLKGSINDLPEEEKTKILLGALKAEREIANMSAELYAALNQDDIFTALVEIANAIENILDNKTNE